MIEKVAVVQKAVEKVAEDAEMKAAVEQPAVAAE